MKKCTVTNLRNTDAERPEHKASCGLWSLRERVTKTDPRGSLLAILTQWLFGKGAPGDADAVPSLKTGP